MRCRADVGVIFLLASLWSCGGPSKGGTAADRSSRAERPMAQRVEAQSVLDSARLALDRDDLAAAVPLLHRAADFYTVQARTPPTAGSAHLVETAHMLETLADSLQRGYRLDPQRVNRLSAYANVAEAERHATLALTAWSTRSKQSACDELLMAADHTERATADGGLDLPPELRTLLDSMRVLARTLTPVPGVDPQVLDEPLTELQAELGLMRQRLALADSSWTKSHWRGT